MHITVLRSYVLDHNRKQIHPHHRISLEIAAYEEPRSFALWQDSRIFLSGEFQVVLVNYKEAMKDSESSEKFLAERLCISNERLAVCASYS